METGALDAAGRVAPNDCCLQVVVLRLASESEGRATLVELGSVPVESGLDKAKGFFSVVLKEGVDKDCIVFFENLWKTLELGVFSNNNENTSIALDIVREET